MADIDSLIGSEHQGIDREMLTCFYTAALSEGGTVDEINLRAIRAVLARWGAAAPAADGEVAKLVEAMREMAYDASQYDTFYLLNRAADLLERQAAAAPVARLPEDAQVIEPANRTILVPVPAPIQVSEQPWERDGWCNERGQCWMGDPGGGEFIPSWRLCRPEDAPNMKVSLPAHALPLPEFE